jgi:hypothetical protein
VSVPATERVDAPGFEARLTTALPFAPFGFVRRIDAWGDRQLLAERLTRPMPPEHDLRFVQGAEDGAGLAVFAEKLPWDSEFFGYGVARLDGMFPLAPFGASAAYGPAVGELLQRARAKGIAYLFAPVDARDIVLLRALGEAGFATIETRLYYHRELELYAHDRRYRVRVATASDIDTLAAAARDTVNPYDRFHADPFITRAQADRLMATWVEASILEGFADVTFVPDSPRPSAFCTVRYHRDKWERWRLRMAQPVFSAVAPESKGWYRKLISEISYHLRDLGAQHVYLTTQATNSVVVRTWESLGYQYGKTEHILRKIL